ncbi:hypothetical protein LTR05_001975 [Lithohypha guttulata]|uniref:4-coumarate-CoA ligase n=1 Tax=Lithohypha guttulata TaxID=1690604 RepID=A0AAN7Y7Q6_9EURO|nr:hypothetical protein LTR05_001975 [Lithohypha guttulata]
MPHKSRWTIPIPDCSLPTFLFTSAAHTEPTTLANKPAYLDAGKPDTDFLTRRTFKVWSQRFACGLTRMPGFKRGERVLVFSGNNLAFAVAFMGILMAGGIFTAANPTFVPRELANQLKDSEACYLLCSEASLDTALEAAKMANLPTDRIRYFDTDILFRNGVEKSSKNGIQYWGPIFASESEGEKYQWPELKGKDEAKETVLALNYSSGTTGVPKGVMVTHRNYVSNCLQHQHLSTLYPDAAARRERSKWLCFLPLYHAMGQTIYLSGGIMRQTPVYIMAKFDFVELLENIQKFRITDLAMVPPIAVMIAKHPIVKKYDLSSIESIGSGAAPLGSEASREVEKIFNGRMNLKQGWGMTEVTCSLLGWDPTQYSESFAVGEPNANCEAKIMAVHEDSKGQQSFSEITERGPEHRGELWCRGPNVMKGYWRNEQATRNTFSPDNERWLRTGDVAYVDKHGHFFIVDRIKELIKVKGNQVAPAELEALILDHKHIADVAVIGIQTPDGDEKPRAFCVKQPGSEDKVTEQDVIDFVSDKVVRYKRLTAGCEFVDAIPKNPSGKILRRQLRDMYTKRQKAKL